jgi:predicted component of viral defense system (DUF524 family)
LYGNLNFGNDIGKFRLCLKYNVNNVPLEFVFEFEIFPVKLNYKRDYFKIIDDIQKAYPLLVLDFLRKTFTGLSKGNELNHEFIWWHIFQTIYNQLQKELNFILNKPHNRLLNQSRFIRKEKLVHLSPSLEEEYLQYQSDPNHYYQVNKKVLSIDTPENRFIKHSLKYLDRTYKYIYNFISDKYKNVLTDEIKKEYENQNRKLTSYLYHPLWKGVGEFTGFKQESLAIQRRPGYAGFYRSFLLLKQGVKFLEDNQKLEFKNIAELYQIWCFIELKNIIKGITGVEPTSNFEQKFEFKHWSNLRIEGAFSCFTFNLHNGDRVELLHDYSYKKDDSDIKNALKSYTEEQRPDITLRLFKKDLPEEAMHTYLFDAKYRINTFQNQEYISDDTPPPDTLNQMHRYRDSLFFKTKNYYNQAEKGVIGGYILFPGESENEVVKSKRYYTSIEEVNIGAFPLNLSSDDNKELLIDFIKTKIFDKSSDSILHDVPGQKYVTPSFPEGMVLIGGTKREKEYQDFFRSGPPFYFFPMNDRKDLTGIRNLKYFSPWLKGIGCKELYSISEVNILKRNELFDKSHPLYKSDDNLYIKISLADRKIELDKEIKSTEGNVYIRYATLNSFLKATKFSDFEN